MLVYNPGDNTKISFGWNIAVSAFWQKTSQISEQFQKLEKMTCKWHENQNKKTY